MFKEYFAENEPVRNKILGIAIPVMFQMLADYILNITDTAFIGQYDVRGLSAITNSLFPYFMFLAFFFATSKGTTILISQSLGANKPKEARRYAEVSFIFNQVLSFVYFLVLFFFAKNIISLVGAKSEILDMGTNYIQIISFQFLFFGFVMSANSVFEGKGITYPIMIASILKTILNIILDYLLIFGHFGFPELGLKGAAIATLISQFIACVVLLIFVFNNRSEFILRLTGIIRTNLKIYLKSFKLGVPAGLDFVLWVFGQNILILMLNKLNPLFSGFYGVFSLILSLSLNLYLGISVAAMNLVGKSTGANKPKDALMYGNYCMFYSLFICLLVAVAFVIFPKNILSLFMKEATHIDNLYSNLYIMAIILFPTALNVVGGNAIRGTGNTMWMVWTQIPGTIFVVGFSYLFVFVLNMGITGVLIAVLLDELLRGIANYIKFFLFCYKRINKEVITQSNQELPQIDTD